MIQDVSIINYGRCGRQGDPGNFKILLSLDDNLLRLLVDQNSEFYKLK
jgi:preprotein translocase subunit SecA